MNHGHTDHDGAKTVEGPAGYGGGRAPSAKELAAPVKSYPGASKLGHDRGPKNLLEGPCSGKADEGYHK